MLPLMLSKSETVSSCSAMQDSYLCTQHVSGELSALYQTSSPKLERKFPQKIKRNKQNSNSSRQDPVFYGNCWIRFFWFDIWQHTRTFGNKVAGYFWQTRCQSRLFRTSDRSVGFPSVKLRSCIVAGNLNLKQYFSSL
jgi:hypothetical protein